MWHEIGDASIEVSQVIVGRTGHIHQFLLALLSVLTVLDGRHAPLLGYYELHVVAVIEGNGVVDEGTPGGAMGGSRCCGTACGFGGGWEYGSTQIRRYEITFSA